MKKILFGAGKVGKQAAREYGITEIECFVDNNKEKIGTYVYGIPVIGFQEMKKILAENSFEIIITSVYHDGIVKQLKENGVGKYNIYVDDEKYYYPTNDLIVNPYEGNEGNGADERKWNILQKNNPLWEVSREMVKEWGDEVPIFSEIEIETINRCNGTCSFCPVSAGNDTRERKIMSRELFEKIIQDLRRLNYSGRIALFSNNEPLLDKRIIELHKYARKALPSARFHLFTNGTLFTLNLFKELVEQLDELIIDNYNQELQLHPAVAEIANYCEQYPEIRKKVSIVLRKPQEILTSRGGDAPNRKEKMSYGDETCILPFMQMIIRPDGRVSLCCNDPLGKNTLGDANINTLDEIWYNDKFRTIRDALRIGRKEWPHCVSCDALYVR